MLGLQARLLDIQRPKNDQLMRATQALLLVLGWSNQEGLEGHQRGLDPIEDVGLPIKVGGLKKGGELGANGGKLGCADGQFSCEDHSKCLPATW